MHRRRMELNGFNGRYVKYVNTNNVSLCPGINPSMSRIMVNVPPSV